MPPEFTFPLVLSALLVSLLLAGSVMAWMTAIARPIAGFPPLYPPVSDRPPFLPAVTAALGCGLIGLLLVLMGLELLLPAPAKEQVFDAEETLRVVRLTLVQNGVIAGVVILTLIGSRADLRALGFHFERPLRQLIDAAMGLLLAIGPVFLLLLVTQLAGLRTEDTEHEFLRLVADDSTSATWFWVALAAVVAAPLTEELLFRVVLQTSLERLFATMMRLAEVSLPSLATWASIGISSVVFCAVHRFPDSIALLPLALVLGYVYHRRRSYWTIVLIHALFNAANLVITALGAEAGA